MHWWINIACHSSCSSRYFISFYSEVLSAPSLPPLLLINIPISSCSGFSASALPALVLSLCHPLPILFLLFLPLSDDNIFLSRISLPFIYPCISSISPHPLFCSSVSACSSHSLSLSHFLVYFSHPSSCSSVSPPPRTWLRRQRRLKLCQRDRDGEKEWQRERGRETGMERDVVARGACFVCGGQEEKRWIRK